MAGFFTESTLALTQALRCRDGEKEVKEWERLVTEKVAKCYSKQNSFFKNLLLVSKLCEGTFSVCSSALNRSGVTVSKIEKGRKSFNKLTRLRKAEDSSNKPNALQLLQVNLRDVFEYNAKWSFCKC